jgi:hypothetical protein
MVITTVAMIAGMTIATTMAVEMAAGKFRPAKGRCHHWQRPFSFVSRTAVPTRASTDYQLIASGNVLTSV